MKNKIKEQLLKIEENVFYGIAPETHVKSADNLDCMIFGVSNYQRKSDKSLDLQGTWYVVIVREDYIPEDLIFQVIDTLHCISGLRLTSDSFDVEYLQKGNTDVTVEAVRLTFSRTIKRGC